MRFITFQQAVMRNKVEQATEEELAKIEEFINTRLEEDVAAQQRPWDTLEGETELDKKKKYLTRYILFSFLVQSFR
jgi:hypothetical protein